MRHRNGFTLIELLVVVTIIGILMGVLIPSVFNALKQAEKAQCAANLKQIGTGCATWASSHRQKWPDAFTSDSTEWDLVGETRTDYYEFNSDPQSGQDNEGASSNDEPINSNTASLWLLVANQGVDPQVFVCPSQATHQADLTVVDYRRCKDFRNVTYISYSYQNVFGGYRLSQTAGRSASLAVAADANPMRKDFYSGSGGGEGGGEGDVMLVTDRELEKENYFRTDDETTEWNQQMSDPIQDPWELNSPNHDFEGQNVLYLDNHVEFKAHPYCGPLYDNIWVRRDTSSGIDSPDPLDIETLRAYNDEDSYEATDEGITPGVSDDSWLVP